jgi:hypothetical protein
LAALVDEIGPGIGPDEAAARLEAAVEDVRRAIDDMRAGQREAEHYELGNAQS